MGKKGMYIVFVLIILFVGYVGFYFKEYHISNDQISIQSSLKDWLNRVPRKVDLNPDIIEVVQLDDTTSYIALYQLYDGTFGQAHLIKGFNGKYKIQHSSHGGSITGVSYQVTETNKGKYMVVFGGNSNLKINHVTAKSIHEDYEFKTDVSKEPYFVKYDKLPEDLKQPFPAELTFFDKNNKTLFY